MKQNGPENTNPTKFRRFLKAKFFMHLMCTILQLFHTSAFGAISFSATGYITKNPSFPCFNYFLHMLFLFWKINIFLFRSHFSAESSLLTATYLKYKNSRIPHVKYFKS